MTEGRLDGYRAALGGLAVAQRGERVRLRVSGRSPGAMLKGIVTNRLPDAASLVEPGVWTGRGWYSAILTPKGRMITDLRIFPDGAEGEEVLLLDLPAPGLAGTLEHFGRFLPPRLARAERVEGAGFLTILGPQAPSWIVREVFGLRADPHVLEGLEEDAFLRMGPGGEEGILVVRSGELAAPAWDILASGETTEILHRRALEGGAVALDPSVVETLRVEAGRPRFGVDMDDGVIPTEAGLDVRAVDHTKGCYTGQEVIVRIRDRGHVNRHLRGLVLPPGVEIEAGAALVREEDGREMGRLTSVVESPRAGGRIGLGWVRREVEVPGRVQVAGGGAVLEVRALPAQVAQGPVDLSAGGWAF